MVKPSPSDLETATILQDKPGPLSDISERSGKKESAGQWWSFLRIKKKKKEVKTKHKDSLEMEKKGRTTTDESIKKSESTATLIKTPRIWGTLHRLTSLDLVKSRTGPL